MKLKLYIYLSILFFSGCAVDSKLTLTMTNLSKADEIDTIEKNGNIIFINEIHHLFIDDFTIDRKVILSNVDGKNIVYNLNEKKNETLYITDKYLAFVKHGEESQAGWFEVTNGKILPELNNSNSISDSLRNSNKDLFIRDMNGIFYCYKMGKLVKQINYGNLIIDSTFNYMNLELNLYRLQNGSLRKISNNPDDLFKQKTGLFYIPPPGYGVLRIYNKKKILEKLDSISKLKTLPKQFSM